MNRSILVVDDEKDMLVLLKRSLEPDLQSKITIASSGEEALKRFLGGFLEADLVLMTGDLIDLSLLDLPAALEEL